MAVQCHFSLFFIDEFMPGQAIILLKTSRIFRRKQSQSSHPENEHLFSVGPKEIISRSGNFSKNSPHSNPAWIDRTIGFTPKSDS